MYQESTGVSDDDHLKDDLESSVFHIDCYDTIPNNCLTIETSNDEDIVFGVLCCDIQIGNIAFESGARLELYYFESTETYRWTGGGFLDKDKELPISCSMGELVSYVECKGSEEYSYSAGFAGFAGLDCVLAKDHIIEGVPCKQNEHILFWGGEGGLLRCVLSEDHEIDGIVFKSDTEITPRHWGTIAYNQVINGVPVLAGTEIGLDYGWEDEPYKLNAFTLSEDWEYNGMVFPIGTWLRFNSDGDLYRAQYGEDICIGDICCKARLNVALNEDNSVRLCVLADEYEWNGRIFPESTWINRYVSADSSYSSFECLPFVESSFDGYPIAGGDFDNGLSFYEKIERQEGLVKFHDDGSLQQFTLAEDYTVDGIRLPMTSEVRLFNNGSLKGFHVREDISAFGLEIIGNSDLWLDEQGEIRSWSVYLEEDRVVQDISFKQGTRISFFPDGNIMTLALREDKEIQGVFLKRGTDVSFFPNGTIRSIRFPKRYSEEAEDIIQIQGFSISTDATSIIFDEDGKLESLTINDYDGAYFEGYVWSYQFRIYFNEDYSISYVENTNSRSSVFLGLTIPPHAQFTVHENRYVDFMRLGYLLSGDQYISNVLLQDIDIPAGSLIYFYPNRNIKRLCLSEDRVIQRVPCLAIRDNAYQSIEFYDNGNLKSCWLSEDTTIQEISLTKEDSVSFSEGGDISNIVLRNNRNIQGVTFNEETQIVFTNGIMQKAFLNEDQRIQGVPCSASSPVFFDYRTVSSCFLSEDYPILDLIIPQGSEYRAESHYEYPSYTHYYTYHFEISRPIRIGTSSFPTGTVINFNKDKSDFYIHITESIRVNGYQCSYGRIEFYPDGVLESCILGLSQDIQSYPCAARSIFFYQNGTLKGFVLNEPLNIQGRDFPRFGEVCFDRNGNVINCEYMEDVNF